MQSIDAELTLGHPHKTWRETAEVVWQRLFSVCCAYACQATLEWNDQQHLAKTKMGHISLPSNFECHNRYNKFLCNSENGDISWCNKNNWEWNFSDFLKKRTETCYLKKNGFFSTLQQIQLCP